MQIVQKHQKDLHIEEDGQFIAKIKKNPVTGLYIVVWYDSDFTTLTEIVEFLKKESKCKNLI